MAVLSLVFILTEALIGAVLVRAELVAGNATMSRAVVMSIHLVNTFALMAFLTLTSWWASGESAIKFRGQGLVIWLLGFAVIGTLILAVSGAVAALGDTLFPSESLAAALNQDMSPTAHFLIRLRLWHPFLALAVGSYCAHRRRRSELPASLGMGQAFNADVNRVGVVTAGGRAFECRSTRANLVTTGTSVIGRSIVDCARNPDCCGAGKCKWFKDR